MRLWHRRRATLALAAFVVAGSPAAGCSWIGGCTPEAGGRCAGPEPVAYGDNRPLVLSPDGRLLIGKFNCGGKLAADETASRVVVRYTASTVRRGGMACAVVPLFVRLHHPLGDRRVVDGVTGAPLTLMRWISPVQVCGARRIQRVASAQFVSEESFRRYVAPRLEPDYGAPTGPAEAPAVWCWQRTSVGRWTAVGVDYAGYVFVDPVPKLSARPPSRPPG